MTISETVEWFNSIFDINKDATNERSKFYCGITDDVERRQEEHHVAKFLGVTRCDTFDTAKEVEKQMKLAGYDTGKQLGDGNENSIYVYLYRKIPGSTIE